MQPTSIFASFLHCSVAFIAGTAMLSCGDIEEEIEESEAVEENGAELHLGTFAGIGQELAIPVHLKDGEEFVIPLRRLVAHGEHLLAAPWTIQEGAGRPLSKGTGAPLTNPELPLVFPRNFNRVSAPDANSCAGCHNTPFGMVGGGGDVVANVFVLGQRFDFVTFDAADTTPIHCTVDELGDQVQLQTVGNERATLGMFGSGYIEMLARQITADLQAIRNSIAPGKSAALVSKGISFGVLSRDNAGNWDTSEVEGLPFSATKTAGPDAPPSLVLAPFHQAGAVVSLRQFTNNAFNHHHGIQSTERFGVNTDPDGDGFSNEMSIADVTAASVFQAVMPVPGRVIPNHKEIEAAIVKGEKLFAKIGCATCHVPALPLVEEGWIYSEPNPYNPPGNLQVGDAPTLYVNLNSKQLPQPRLSSEKGVVWVPAFTDLKLHDITDGPNDPNSEPLNMHHPGGSDEFHGGNSRFLTRKLWGVANEPPYFHHGKYTTLREAVLAHAGEALDSREAFEKLSADERDSMIEFLKSLQILRPGTRYREVDENYHPKPKNWRKKYMKKGNF